MAPTIQRPLQLWEQVGSTINISMYLELQGHGVTSATVSHALKALQTQHPFLRMGIEYQENVATLIELPSSALIPSAKAGLYPKWQARLQELANEFKDLAEGVMSVDFASDGEQHQLFLTLNHAGSDAVALSHMCDALLINLSQACQNKGVSPKSERKLHNIFDNMEAWLPMDISKRLKPAIPAAHMPPLSPDRMQEIVEPYMASVWSELDANWTQALISRCKEHGVTVGAAFSVASMLAMARAQARSYPLPQNMLMQTHINMRSQVGVRPPLEADECVNAVSYLWWCQQLSGDETVWAVVAKSSKALKEEKSKKSGLAFWHRVLKDFYSPPYTVSASSLGVSPIKAAYGPLKVKQQHMMVGSYGLVTPDDATIMSHAHTFDGRLCTVFTFARPAVSQDLGQDMAHWQQQVLKRLAAPDSDDTLVSQLLAADS